VTADKALRVPDYLHHILEAIARIERYTRDLDETLFLHDEKTHDAVIRNIEIIGEAARNSERDDPAFASRHPELPLARVYRMRNKVAHGYFQVDLNIVWKTARLKLPELAPRIRAILQANI